MKKHTTRKTAPAKPACFRTGDGVRIVHRRYGELFGTVVRVIVDGVLTIELPALATTVTLDARYVSAA